MHAKFVNMVEEERKRGGRVGWVARGVAGLAWGLV